VSLATNAGIFERRGRKGYAEDAKKKKKIKKWLVVHVFIAQTAINLAAYYSECVAYDACSYF
jgi:hypothetical protein